MLSTVIFALTALPLAIAQETVYGVYVRTSDSVGYNCKLTIGIDILPPRRPHTQSATACESNPTRLPAGLPTRRILPQPLHRLRCPSQNRWHKHRHRQAFSNCCLRPSRQRAAIVRERVPPGFISTLRVEPDAEEWKHGTGSSWRISDHSCESRERWNWQRG
jgi:hypothetical protein